MANVKKSEVVEPNSFLFAQYIMQGYSTADAYLKIKPHVKRQTARNGGKRMLDDPDVQDYLARYQKQMADATQMTQEYLASKLMEVIEDNEAEQTRDRLEAIKLGAKIMGHEKPALDKGKPKEANQPKVNVYIKSGYGGKGEKENAEVVQQPANTEEANSEGPEELPE